MPGCSHIYDMNTIVKLIDDYSKNLKEIGKSNCEDTVKLEQGIAISKKTLNQMRLKIRANRFPSKKAEITFFKLQKPFVHARLIYFMHRHNYYSDRPKSQINVQKKYIKGLLKRLETKKNKHLEFYRYYDNGDKCLDYIYFTRRNTQLEIFHNDEHFDKDPEFCTSHGYQAAEVLAYKFLMIYYTKELDKLKIKESQQIGKEIRNPILNNITWTASKTDLVELVYALIACGAIKNGEVEIKNVVKACQLIFNIDLGNIYKTYTEIKARDKDLTKFLDNLKLSLTKKIESDYEKI